MPIRLPPGSAKAPLPTGSELDGARSRGADGAERQTAAKAVEKLSHGRSPEEVFEGNVDRLMSPSSALKADDYGGYTWDAKELDDVMRQFGVGDADGLIRTAIALDQGDRYLSKEELIEAARLAGEGVTAGFRWSPAVLADVMQQKGVTEEGALLRAAKRIDDGDHVLSRAELERAADVLLNVVQANDVMAIYDRIEQIAAKAGPDVDVETLGADGGLPVKALHFPATSGDPLLNVVVTGGVHGDEPCGAGAATLLLEQLVADPRIRENISFTVVPMVHPEALAAGERRSADDVDLNRTFVGVDDDPPEADFMQALHKNNDYDLALDLHSGKAKRNGFWVLHKESEDILAPAMARFGRDFPRLNGDAKPYDLSSPGVAESGSTATLKDLAFEAGARWAMTVEAPGSVSYRDQVLGENSIVHEVVREAAQKVVAERVAAGDV